MSTYTLSSKSDGVIREFIATITGTGAALTINCGFQPKRVKLYDVTAVTIYEWVYGMPAGDSFKLVSGADLTLDTGSVVVVSSKDTELQADIANGTVEPGVTFSGTALVNGHTLIAFFE